MSRLDSVHVQLASRPDPVELSWEARDELLERARRLEGHEPVVTAFEAVGASRPVILSRGEKEWLYHLVDHVWIEGERVNVAELPRGIWDLRNTLNEDLHGPGASTGTTEG
jgi:hypothetical protein